jgi:hypothetical protein
MGVGWVMATSTCYLVHDPAFSRPNVWRLADSGTAVRVRLRMASGPEHVFDLALGDLRLRAHDEDTFIAGPMPLEGLLGRVEIVMRGAPEEVSAALREAVRR